MKLLMALMVIASVYAVSARAGNVTDRQVVAMACAEEARLAHCGRAVVGDGLLRCLHAYPFAQLSPGCQRALSQLRADSRVVISPRPVIVVRPTYAIPAPGYLWRQHPRYGWGWYHPRLGWHRGWR
jgi:hypothetical protein